MRIHHLKPNDLDPCFSFNSITQYIDRVLFVDLNPDDRLLYIHSPHQQTHPNNDLWRTLDHGAMIRCQIRLAFGPVNKQEFRRVLAHRKLDVRRESRTAQSYQPRCFYLFNDLLCRQRNIRFQSRSEIDHIKPLIPCDININSRLFITRHIQNIIYLFNSA